jgi:hypothetical protein
MPWVEENETLPIIDYGNSLEDCGIIVIFQMLKNSPRRLEIRMDQI